MSLRWLNIFSQLIIDVKLYILEFHFENYIEMIMVYLQVLVLVAKEAAIVLVAKEAAIVLAVVVARIITC